MPARSGPTTWSWASPRAAPPRSSVRRSSRAQTLGARTALVSCSEPPALLKETCDVCITVLVGPEIVTGSTRMKSGTATKLVLNTLTTGAMIRLGKVYGNLMVDLRAWNDKLVDRSHRILMETTGLAREAARTVLDAAEGSVKTAIVMARRQREPRGGGAAAGRARGTSSHRGRQSSSGPRRMSERPASPWGSCRARRSTAWTPRWCASMAPPTRRWSTSSPAPTPTTSGADSGCARHARRTARIPPPGSHGCTRRSPSGPSEAVETLLAEAQVPGFGHLGHRLSGADHVA